MWQISDPLLFIDDLTTEDLLIAFFIVSKRIWSFLFNRNVYVKNVSILHDGELKYYVSKWQFLKNVRDRGGGTVG